MNAGQSQAYRGYLVTKAIVLGFVISKDGHHISWADSMAHAQKIINELLD